MQKVKFPAAPKPPSAEGGGFDVRRRRRERNKKRNDLSPSHAVRMTAPSSEGALVAFTAAFTGVIAEHGLPLRKMNEKRKRGRVSSFCIQKSRRSEMSGG